MVAPVKLEAPYAPLRVLLVENSGDDALLLLRELKRGGYETMHERVETPEAMERALAQPWDVILSDYWMPRFSATEALELAHRMDSEAPFIVVSGKVGEDVAVEAMKAGAYDYVMKDNLARLRAVLERSLHEAQEKRDLRQAERELQRRGAILEAVRFAADQFLGETVGWQESVRMVLRRLGEATKASRVYVFENYAGEDGELWATMRYEWVAEDVSEQIDNPVLKAIPYRAAGFGRWLETLGRGDFVHGHVRELPESEQPELRAEEILSIVVVPIFVEGRWWGFIGFDECREEREWSASEIGALGAAAGTLGAAIRRKRTENRLGQSEERYRAVIEQATENIFLIDVGSRRIVESNHAFREALGYSEEELHRMTLYDIVTADRESVDRSLRRTMEEGRSPVGERRYRCKDGTLLDVEVGGSVILRDGRQTLVAVAHDITERKRNEEALRESEERFRSAFESAAIGMALVTPDGRWLRVNRPLCDMVGYPEQELLELTFQDITHPDDLDADVRQVEQTLWDEIRAFQMEKRYLHKDGHVVWILLSVSLVRDYEGNPLYFISQMQDITERKRAEEEVRESQRALATLMSNLPGMAYRCHNDEDWTMKLASEGCSGLTGYSPGDLIGNRRMSYADLIHPEDREAVWEGVQDGLRERRPFQFTYRIMTASGTLKWVWEQGQGVFSPEGEVLALEGFVTDTTERKRVQELLEERVATLSGIASDLTLDRPTEAVLGALAESVVNASTAVACGIVLIGEKEDAAYLFGSHGLPEGYTSGLQEAYRAGAQSPSLEAFRGHRPVLMRDLRAFLLADPVYSPIHRFMREVPWDIVYSLPLVSRGRALGAIFFCFLPGQEPGEDEKVFLQAVADQAAVAVENARLLSEARGKAALEERQKLARELHDSVSQALYGISLGAETARELLQGGDPERAAEPLDYTVALAEAGMTDMRALIFELRPESLEREGLVAALEKQAAAVQARHGIRVKASFCEEPEAPLEAKESIYRIAQEALHNIVKHACASSVKLNLERDSEGITLEVSDDGAGFEARGDFPGHLGLKSMRERASRLGGTLEIESSPGHGARILARFPSR